VPFWKKKSEAELHQEAMQEASLNALKEGDIPAQARHRLESQASANPPFFTSSFSPKEYLLARQGGYDPIGQVIGAAFIAMEEEAYNNGTIELFGRTQTNRVARDFAIERMRKEATVLGADGIVGVRIALTKYSWTGEKEVVEFTASGTAIRIPGLKEWRTKKQCPFTSTLSGQEFWQLYQAGYWPLGLVIGNCTHAFSNQPPLSLWGVPMVSSAIPDSILGSIFNQELTVGGEAFSLTRKLAMERMLYEMKLLGAIGVVDVDIDYKVTVPNVGVQAIPGWVGVEFLAMGTAVTDQFEEGPRPQKQEKRLMVIDLAKSERRGLKFDLELKD